MSFGLKTSFGRLVKPKFPPFIVIDHDDYFNVIYQNGKQSNEYQTDDYIFGKDDLGFYMINKHALAKVKRQS